MTQIRCIESTTGYWQGRGFNWEADRTYEVDESQLATVTEGFHYERVGSTRQVETAEAVADPPRRKRGRPRKTEA